jgi:aspartyl-tRNA(Asn)/glutamyl-tRNA(Gln) amidotransferase subunit B
MLTKEYSEFEVARQIELIESGKTVEQETRGMDEKTRTTHKLRGKEDAPDYR